MLTTLIAALGMLLTIFFVVGIHETGHFLAARLLGVKILRFSIGFGKTLFHWYDKKGTEYVLAMIPLGGYVKMLDDDEEIVAKEDLKFAYYKQPFYKKIIIVAAGPVFNLLFAFIIYWAIFVVGFVSIVPITGHITPHSIAATAGLKPNQEIIRMDNIPTHSWMSVIIRILSHMGDADQISIETKPLGAPGISHYTLNLSHWHMDKLKPDPLASLGISVYEPIIPTVIGRIEPNTPAARSGLAIGDKIIRINAQPIENWTEMSDMISDNPNKTLSFEIEHQGKKRTIPILIEAQHSWFSKPQGLLGISPDFTLPAYLTRHIQYNPIAALPHAWQNMMDFCYLNFLTLEKLLTGKASIKSLGGPISILTSAGASLNQGILPFFSFLAFLSIAIGVLNILPIPGLDGGHILFQLIETLLQRPLSPRIQLFCYRLGFAILILLIIQSVTNDVLRLA